MPMLAGDACVGLIAPGWVPVLGADDDSVKFVEIYQATYPKEIPSAFAAAGFIAGEVFCEGLRRVGKNPTRESLIAAMESLRDWDGILAKGITYTTDFRSGKTSMYFMEFEANTVKVISDWVKLKI
jgi:branched-chain amino acid transport system substrate-binding protein